MSELHADPKISRTGRDPASDVDVVALRANLLELHRSLIEWLHRVYVRQHGPHTPSAFLQALVNDASLHWLEALTARLVALDESSPPGLLPEGFTRSLRSLLVAGEDGQEFQRQYGRALQEEPAVVLAHAAVLRALPAV